MLLREKWQGVINQNGAYLARLPIRLKKKIV